MITKYSQLKQREPRYDLPDDDEVGLPDFEAYMQEIHFVTECRKELLKQKLQKGAARTPANNYGLYDIVSKEPTDNSKWRVTTFDTAGPISHSICSSVTEGYDSVYESLGLSDEQWVKWSQE